MKTKLFFVILLFIIPFGCKEERKIEVIEDYDKIYLFATEVDSQPKLVDGDIASLKRKIFQASEKYSYEEKFYMEFKLYLNEKGDIEKLRVLKSPGKEINDLLLEEVKNWKFSAAILEGKPTKSQYTIKFTMRNNGEINFIDVNEYLIVAEQMPELIGGLKSIQEKIVYPAEAKKQGIQGKVYILAFINENGNVVESTVIKGIGGGCDEAALDAVKNVKFTPAKNRNKVVKVQVTIPIVFKLQ